MGFLAPWFLAGAAALGLPLYLHLLKRQQREEIPFSSLMFFAARPHTSIRQRRLRYFALLALRLLLLLLLALAFADPFWKRWIPASASGEPLRIIALDQSFSMRTGNRFLKAQQEALDFVGSLPASARAQVLAASGQMQMLTKPTGDREELRAAIKSIVVSDARLSFGELARTIRNTAQSAKMPVQLHLFSDLQESAMPPRFADASLPEASSLVVHPVAAKPEANWFVESVNVPYAVYSGRKLRAQAIVGGYNTPAALRTVSLVLNGRVLASKPLNVPANGRATVEFANWEAPYGLNRGEVRIDAADALHPDDQLSFALERGEPRKVLFVHESRDSRGLLYFQNALAANGDPGFIVEPVTTDRLGSMDLKAYAFVVLSDPGTLPVSFVGSLQSFVANGAAVLVATGTNLAGVGRVPVFDGAVRGSNYRSLSDERFQTVASTDPEFPAVRRADKWQGVKFYQSMRVDPAGARVLARLTDETPVLIEKRVGEGRALLFASTFDNVANDFPLHASFVPFVEQTARYLAGVEDKQPRVAVDSYIELRSAREKGTSVEVTGPDGRRALTLSESATARNLQVTRAGFYEVRRSNGRQELIAANPDRRESDLTPIPAEKLKLWTATGQSSAAAVSTSGPAVQERTTSFWWYVLFLGLLCAVAESLYASRYWGMEREPQ